jgi:esterase/lipase
MNISDHTSSPKAVVIFHSQAGRGRAQQSANGAYLEDHGWQVYGPFYLIICG